MRIQKLSLANFALGGLCFFGLSGSGLGAQNLESGRWHSLISSRFYHTIRPNYPINGPRLNLNNESEYAELSLKEILREAHLQVIQERKAGNFREYANFLLAALATPLHESRMIHFREIQQAFEFCNDEFNQGVGLSKISPKLAEIFESLFRKPSNQAVFPNCSAFQNQSQATQIIGSSDRQSVGLYQVTLRWHPDFANLKTIFSTQLSTRYALGYLKQGWSHALWQWDSNPKAVSCLKDSKTSWSNEKLLQASWAFFNSGQKSKLCRFSDLSDSRDRKFLERLQKFKTLDGQDPVIKALPQSSRSIIRLLWQIADSGSSNPASLKALDQYLGLNP